ncbi:glucose 1-dehydrogenase [Sediminibacillus dalangtanensis]|uniref:Glucose 1-dehydrogenase n=1 Tax=Sediminibacillus dalangtanensis TaxID=2729421 RepID=A0ABX7VNW7_9BACI|nr:glucose 1-dehydrogenase [Sediminibacillus dalangtanensis]QTM98569.1 glucose 1-dehydrogenase [Sediminibacillus dalangtanensis]
MTFTDKTVIVTGAGSGIGAAVAAAYGDAGAKIVVAEKDVKAGKATVTEIEKKGGNSMFVETDVRRPEDIEHLVMKTVETYGKIDILINNAGVSRFKSIYELTVDDWDDVLNTNLRGNFLCAQQAAKKMRDNPDGGAIVNIASTRAFMSEADSEAYAASKGGISALTHALAISLSKDRIRVNAISPGWIETGDYGGLRSIDHAQHPAKRVGKPEDVARACLFLTDPRNDFVTGENFILDGGMTRKMIYEH